MSAGFCVSYLIIDGNMVGTQVINQSFCFIKTICLPVLIKIKIFLGF